MRSLLTLALVLPAVAAELLSNGDFELPLDSGWTVDSGGHARVSITRDTGYQPDPDFEARIHLGPADGRAALSQTVPVTTTELVFRADLCLFGRLTEPINWSAASCRLTYLDSALSPLGETRIYYASWRCPWQNTPTIHLIPAPDSSWHSYVLDIAAELRENLPGVDPQLVRAVRVALKDTAGAS